MRKEYPNLSSPVRIGQIELPTRLVMAPVDTQYATEEGYVTPRLIDFYRRRAGRGMALIISENTGVDKGGKSNIRMLGLFDDSCIKGLRELVSIIHRAGSRIIFQLNHAGRQTTPHFLGGKHPVAASAIPCPLIKVKPLELKIGQIEEMIGFFADASVRARKSGSDGVELHMAHGYLLCGFLSPFSNKRTDQYGGTREGRILFPLQVLRAIREKLPPPFIVGCRISGDEQVEGGLTLKDTIPIAQRLECEGTDYIHVSCCNNASGHKNIPSYYEPPGVFVEYAAAIKQAISIPVITVGRLYDLDFAERILAEGKADLAAAARPFIADPDFGLKLGNLAPDYRIGNESAGEKKIFIATSKQGPNCLYCNRCIASLVKTTEGIVCTVNPHLGIDEFQKSIRPVELKKYILVVGGGPAGMIAAYRAARRGHQVTLWEQKSRPGGALYYAGLSSEKEGFRDYLRYLKNCLQDSPVKVEMERVADIDTIGRLNPDEVIIAAGAAKADPQIPGIDSVGWETVHNGFDRPSEKGDRVLIVGGGGRGAELAEFLANKGASVTLVARRGIALDTPLQIRHYLEQRLLAAGVEVLLKTELLGLHIEKALAKRDEKEQTLTGFNRVILAYGERPNTELYNALIKKGISTRIIGDAAEPRDLFAAVREGTMVGNRV
jgi:2,4-dienoyl-CoA reductase-like NADH-dependent reductase (Old Yellow Enzyme family)/thioredoxin reductase